MKIIPIGQIELIVGRMHVSTPDDEIRDEITKRTKGKEEWTPELIKQAQDYAISKHRENQGIYRMVMRGTPIRDEIEDLKLRAGITEQYEEKSAKMRRMEHELADSWINGNRSHVQNTLHRLDTETAVALALRIYLYLSDASPGQERPFAQTMINAAR